MGVTIPRDMGTALVCAALLSGAAARWEPVWTTPLPFVAVTEATHWRNQSAAAVTITTFNAGGGSTVGLLSGDFSQPPKLQVLDAQYNWPNQASGRDLDGKPIILTAGGMLVPGHGTGEVALIDPSTGIQHAVSQPKEDYFYHQASMVGMISCREGKRADIKVLEKEAL